MISKLEILPNEILLSIFSHLSWDEILISLWPLNQRIMSLICSTLSMNKNGIIFNKPGLSYRKFSFDLLPLILKSLSLSSNIKYLHFDGHNAISFDFIYQEIFHQNDKPRICFRNLKSLYITQCFLSRPLIQVLSSLIQYQLNHLTLSIHEDFYKIFDSGEMSSKDSIQEERINISQQILCQIFSDQCQLTSLQLDIRESSLRSNHYCLNSSSHLSLNTTTAEFRSSCLSLRRLKIRLYYTCFLEELIEHVPNLEQLSVHCPQLQRYPNFSAFDIENSSLLNKNWIDKVTKLKCFTLNSSIENDFQFTYLKWLLNNVSHVIKLELQLCSNGIWSTHQHQTIWKLVIDADFIRQYCLPDQIIHLKYFHFYIRAERSLLLNDSEEIINSFHIHPFFIDHQWTNIRCFYSKDRDRLNQYIFSSNIKKFEFFNLLIDHPYVYHESDIHHIKLLLRPSLCSLLEQFNELCPNASCITIHPVNLASNSEMLTSLEMEFQMKRINLSNIQFRNVTKLRLGTNYSRNVNTCHRIPDDDIILAKVFAHIISMCVQLKYLCINRFECFLHIARFAFVNLRKDALRTVCHAEFGITSCHIGNNESIHTGEHLVPLLSIYMPHLQTLCLWRPDDFPWTSIRPDFSRGWYGILVRRWCKSLSTSELITQHVAVFQQDLSQLFGQLRQLVYVNIYGKTYDEKVEPYRLMIQTHFTNSRFDIQTSRFRLWI